MPLDIQSGGIAESIRRALGVRGRMPLRLDETVVPVAQVGRFDQPPFRLLPVDFMGDVDQPAVAAENGFAGVHHPIAVPGATVLAGTLVMSTTSADQYELYYGGADQYLATQTAAPLQSLSNIEHPLDITGATTAPPVVPIMITRGTHPTLGLGRKVGRLRLLNGEQIVLPFRVTLRPGWVFAVWRSTVNLDLSVTFHGTWFPDAPPS